MCFGVPVGEDQYVRYKLQEIAERLPEVKVKS